MYLLFSLLIGTVVAAQETEATSNDHQNPWLTADKLFGVPLLTYAFWFGGKMGEKRLDVLNQIKANVGTPVVLITAGNVTEFEVKEHPFHPIVKYSLENKKGLSGNHLSDYFRLYIGYHWGGHYTDLKGRDSTQGARAAWDAFKDDRIWLVGMKWTGNLAADSEVEDYILQNKEDTPDFKKLKLTADGKWDQKNYKPYVVSNGGWIIRPASLIIKKVMDYLEKERMTDQFSIQIKQHPVADFKRCCQNNEVPGYPVTWAALMGSVFEPYQALFRSHINADLPMFNYWLGYSDDSEKVT